MSLVTVAYSCLTAKSYGVTEKYREGKKKSRRVVNMMPSCAVASPRGAIDDVEISRAQPKAGRCKGNRDKFRYRCLAFEPTKLNTKSLDMGKIQKKGL